MPCRGHACARPCSRDAGASGTSKTQNFLYAFDPPAVPCEHSRQATESEGKAFRMSEARRASFRNAPRTTEPDGKEWSPGALLWGHLSSGKQERWRKKCFQEAHDPCLFSAPRFTGPRRHATMSWVFPAATIARKRLRCARAGMILGFTGSALGIPAPDGSKSP
jgi:hypothetical protein